jgi:MOSC domain-containing protein YiiM
VSTLSGAIVSVRVGRITAYERPAWDHVKTRPYQTAFRKAEVTGPVHVGPLGLAGDEQADKKFHGGPEMAVLMYAESHYAGWRLLEGLADMGPGGFGENLTVSGLDETQVCVGDVLEVGGTRLQVSSPRGPCADISRRWDREWLLKEVVARRHTGWYLRVLAPGEVQVGDRVRLLERPHAGWTIDRMLRLRYVTPRDVEGLREASAIAAFDAEWREKFAEMAGDEGTGSRT